MEFGSDRDPSLHHSLTPSVPSGTGRKPLYERIKAVEGHPGRPAIDPRLLVALWARATLEWVAFTRQWVRLCDRDDAFKWLRGGVNVNEHTP